MDLAFILDSSSSVSASDFRLMLRFAADVVHVMNVSSDGVRVADIVYSSTVVVHFGLNNYTTTDQVGKNFMTTEKRKQQ